MVSSAELIEKVVVYVRAYMNNFDGSHDFNHIERVAGVAHAILEELELSSTSAVTTTTQPPPSPPLDRTLVTLAALLHDVGDRKYLKPGEDAKTMVRDVLLGFGAARELAETVQTICAGVSYSSEVKDLDYVVELIKKYPELAVVQDADRLDSIGAVGIGRVFAFGAAKGNRGMAGSVDHFDEKLLKVEALMKTAPGKRIAAERTEKLRIFKKWWEGEMEVTARGITWV